MKIFEKIEQSDIMYLIGLPLLGVGLFFVYGLGLALTGAGAVFILLGFFGSSQ
jgi:hypothetical protein